MQTVNVNGREWEWRIVANDHVWFERNNPDGWVFIRIYKKYIQFQTPVFPLDLVADLPALVAHAKTLLNPEAK
jgi:hypothetical protein